MLSTIKNRAGLMRLWVSWVCTSPDYRPVSFPPNEMILGWWKSGEDSNGNATLCALIATGYEADAFEAIKKDWPEFDGLCRFADVKPGHWLPGDRFPLNDWMRERCYGAKPC